MKFTHASKQLMVRYILMQINITTRNEITKYDDVDDRDNVQGKKSDKQKNPNTQANRRYT